MPSDREEIAATIRACWVEEYRKFILRTKGVSTDWGSRSFVKWDGGQDSRSGAIYKNVWLSIADNCIEHDVDPYTFVKAMFHNRMKTPWPNMATGEYGIGRYSEYMNPKTQLEIKSDIVNSFEAQKARILSTVSRYIHFNKWDEKDSWIIAITDHNEPFTPLFRYSVAKNQGWTDVANEYLIPARQQYKTHRKLYDEVWEEWIPDELRSVELL